VIGPPPRTVRRAERPVRHRDRPFDVRPLGRGFVGSGLPSGARGGRVASMANEATGR
jgi:hypothetical protein